MDVNFRATTGTVVAAVGAVLAAVGTFLTWVDVETPVGGVAAAAGIETTTGLLVLLVALVGLGALVVLPWDRGRLVVAGAGAAVALLALVKFADADGLAGAGVGLYLSALGGLVLAGGGGYGYLQESPDGTDADAAQAGPR